MDEQNLVVKEWIKDAKDNLDKYVSDAITYKKKIHIRAPVGTGKTSYAIDIIKKYQDEYQFIILEPLKSIASQVNARIYDDDDVVDAFEYNADKLKELEEWEEYHDSKWPHTFLSTIDSAWRLFEEDKVDPEKTVVIIDESHAFIQDARPNFDRSVDAFIDAGCPVIGFSATVSSWVLEYLFKMDQTISIEVSDIPPKVIHHFIERKISKIIAYEIKEQGYKKVIVWTESFDEQDDVYDAIKEVNPTLNVIKLNAETRDDKEAENWKHIIDKETLPEETNVAIINKVAQAGININDNNIELVILYGKFDPYGFQQYLGRTRNYDGVFYFMHYDYGGSTKDWEADDQRESYQEYIQNRIDKIDETFVKYQIDIPVGLEDVYLPMPDGSKGYRLSKCLYANKIYKRYRDLHGTNLIKVINKLDPDLTFLDYKFNDELINQIISDEKAKKRHEKFVLLPDLVVKYAKDLISLEQFYEAGIKHLDVDKLIEESSGDARIAKKRGLLYIPKSRKDGFRNTISMASKSRVSIQRLIVASTEYIEGGKDESIVKQLLDTDQVTVHRITQLMKAIQYYNHTFKTYNRYTTMVLNNISPCISDSTKNRQSATKWKELIQDHLKGIRRTLPQDISTQIFRYNLITAETKMVDKATGKSKNVLKLKQVVNTYYNYVSANNLYKFD